MYIYLHFFIIPTLFAYFLECHPYTFYISNVLSSCFCTFFNVILSVTMSTAMFPLITYRTDMVDKGYSKTSYNGPFEKQTTSVQWTAHLPPIDFTTELIHFEPPTNGHLSTPNNGH